MRRFIVQILLIFLCSIPVFVNYGNASDAHQATEQAIHESASTHEPVIENWWSFKNRQVTPPFGFAIVNFVIFLALLHQTAGKQLRHFLKTRSEEMATFIQDAETKKSKALEQVEQLETAIQSFETTRQKLISEMLAISEKERLSMLADAASQTARMHREYQKTIELEKKKAFFSLKKDISEMAAQIAKQAIINTDDAQQNRMFNSPLIELEKTAQGRLDSNRGSL